MIFVDHDIAIFFRCLSTQIGILIEELIGEAEQIIEIDEIIFEQIGFILFIDFSNVLVVRKFRLRVRFGRIDERILIAGNFTGDQGSGKISIDFFNDFLFVIGIDNYKIISTSQQMDMKFEKKEAEFMKGTKQRGIGILGDKSHRPLTHLFGRFIGKSEGECVACGNSDLIKQIRKACGNGFGFSASCSCQNEQRTVNPLHRTALCFIKI